MSAKHTPGPWTHAPKEVLGNSVLAGDLLICLLCGSGEESDANGRLIAAAPELLEMVKLALRNEESRLYMLPASDAPAISREKDILSATIGRYRRAIARAEGGQS